jgi:hypothetical protein
MSNIIENFLYYYEWYFSTSKLLAQVKPFTINLSFINNYIVISYNSLI